MSLNRDTSRRHYADHPLRHLTDEELHVLDRLSNVAYMLNSDLCDVMISLGMLAVYEQAERYLKADASDAKS